MTTKETQGLPQDTLVVETIVGLDGHISASEHYSGYVNEISRRELLSWRETIRSLSKANAALEVERDDLFAARRHDINDGYRQGRKYSEESEKRLGAILDATHDKLETAKAALSAATLEIERLKGVLEPVDWTVDDTLTAKEILNYLGIGSDPSLEPGDRRRDKVAGIIRTRIDAALAASKTEAAEQRSHDLEGGH